MQGQEFWGTKMSISKPVLGVTLARGGSKGVPGKHLRLLAGRPLIDYTLDIVKEIKEIDYYLVSTNSEEIRSHVLKKGVNAPFLRPESLSTDTASSVSALQHAVNFVENDIDIRFSYVVELMATNPLKDAHDVSSCINRLENENLDAVIAVNQIFDHHPARVKRIENGLLLDFCVPEIPESRRQDLVPRAYVRSGAIYALTREMLVKKGLRYGTNKCGAHLLPPEKAINIDSEQDFHYAEYLLNRRQNA